MTGCPELDSLEASPLAPTIRAHVEDCGACTLVVELFDRMHARGDGGNCLEFDALLAARNDGSINDAGRNLLERHLASCLDCREVAETLSPVGDTAGDHALLPSVDPSAYALGLEVARGGMGRILAARDLRVGRPVAVKELLGHSPQLAARFEREARVTARLQHPGIVPIYEIGRWPDGTPFYTMRMVDGRTLRETIDRTPTLAGRLALLPAIIAASEAIAFAHGQRVIHRDLTPSNVLVGAYGETVVIDWGLAKDLAGHLPDAEQAGATTDPDTSLTGAGAVIGTAMYMPPEQAHAQPVDERADVYALGAILYHLLAGAPPYTGQSTAELLRAVRVGPPTPIQAAVQGVPRDLVSIVTKAMARDPALRYPSANELTAELKRFRTGRMVEAHEYSTAERMVRFIRRYRAALTVTVLASLLLGVFATVAVTRNVRSNRRARLTVRDLLVEKGRIELLAGNHQGARAYLHEAFRTGDHTAALMFLLGSAAHGFETASRPLECGGDVRSFDFSRDGESVAAACTNTGKIWRLDGTGTPISLIAPPVGTDPRGAPVPSSGGFDGLRYSPTGAMLATWGKEGVVRLWDARSGVLRGSFTHGEPGTEITFTTFTPDETKLATAGFDGVARIWDIATGTELRSIAAGTGLLRHLYGQLSRDGTLMLTVTLEGEGKGWDSASGAFVGGFSHGSLVVGGDLSPDGKLALTCGVNRLVKVWELATGKLLLTLAGHTDVVWKCVFSDDSTRVLTSGHDGRANVWSLATGAMLTSVIHGDILWTGHFAPDARRFLTVGVDGRVKVWDTSSGALLATHDAVRGTDAKFSPDGRHLVIQRGDGRVQIWRDASRQAVISAPHGATLLGVSADGTRAAFEAGDGAVTLWHAGARGAIAHQPIHRPIVFDAHRRVAAATAGGIVVLDLDTGAVMAELPLAHAPAGLQLSYAADRLLVTSNVGAPEVWQIEPRTRLATLTGATHAHLSRDGRRVLAWTAGAPPQLWDLDRDPRQPQRTLQVSGRFSPIGFSGAGTRLVLLEDDLATSEPFVSVWNTRDGTRVIPSWHAPVDNALDRVTGTPSLDPSGRWLTMIGADHRVTVYDVETGQSRASFVGEQLMHAQADASGKLIAVLGEYGKTALVLSATDGRVLARWPVDHASPAITQEDFLPPAGLIWWAPDGSAVVSWTVAITVWRAASATEDYDVDAARRELPFTVTNGQLELATNRRLSGRVVRAGQPVVGARVSIEIRTPAVNTANFNWSKMKSRSALRHVVTDGDGRFVIAGLVPGYYGLSVGVPGVPGVPGVHADEVDVSTEDDPVTIDVSAP